MRTIYKYTLDIIDEQTINIPVNSEPLCVLNQKDQLCVWFLVNPENEKEAKKIFVYGTGSEVPDTATIKHQDQIPSYYKEEYIGSCIMGGGNLVWHVFCEVK